MRLNLPVRLAWANTRTAGREIIVTNGLSVRQEQGCGCLFYCAKKNRLCLSSYSTQRERVTLGVFVFTEHVSVFRDTRKGGSESVVVVARFSPENQVTFWVVLMLLEGGAPISEFITSAGGVWRLAVICIWILLRFLPCGKHNAPWPALRVSDLIGSSLVFYSLLHLPQSLIMVAQLS